MEKAKNVFSQFVGLVFFLVFLAISLCVVFVDGDKYSFNRVAPFISALIGSVVATALLFIYQKLAKDKKQVSKKKEIIIVSIAMLIFLGIGLFVISVLRVSPTWDVGHVYEAALSMANNGDLGKEYGYISNFPYQTFLVGAFAIIIKCTSWLLHPKLTLMLINLFLILGSILFCYLSTKKLLGVKKAIFSLVLFLLFSPILLYASIFYTDTISMFFVTGGFYLALLLLKNELSLKKQIMISLILGLFCFCGYQIKATSIILIVAIAIFALLIKERVSIKRIAISTLCVVVVFVPSSMIVSNYAHRITDRSLEIPKTHWVMQGLKGYGGFNMEDYTEITYPALGDNGHPTEKHIEEINKRLGAFGLSGYIQFLSKKISFTWGDGTYFVGDKLRRSPSHPESLAYKIVSADGEYFSGYNIWMNGLQIMLLIGITVGAFITRKDRTEINIIKIALVGTFAFLLIWETRSRYLINYLPLMFILLMYSIEKIVQLKISFRKK